MIRPNYFPQHRLVCDPTGHDILFSFSPVTHLIRVLVVNIYCYDMFNYLELEFKL